MKKQINDIPIIEPETMAERRLLGFLLDKARGFKSKHGKVKIELLISGGQITNIQWIESSDSFKP